MVVLIYNEVGHVAALVQPTEEQTAQLGVVLDDEDAHARSLPTRT